VTDPDAPLAGLRCLVLDDEMLIALDIQQTLEAAGAAVVMCVANVAEALAALREAPKFDLAILDVMLSGAGDSLALAAVLSQQRTPFIFLTGLRAADVQHTTKFPHTPVVEKPFSAHALLKALAQALTVR
jgi:CheY-like chemotaxis protein